MDPAVAHLVLQDRRIAYAIIDRDLDVVELSGAVDILRDDQKTWLGRSLLDLVPELVGAEAALRAILGGQMPRFQLSLVNRETDAGRTVYLTMVDLPFRDRTGEIVGIIHLVEDVTEMGTLEQHVVQQRNELRLLGDELARQNLDLAAANAELRQLDEMKSMFVSIAAHELRNPLTAIIGYVEILLDDEEDTGPLSDQQRDCLETVQRAGQRLLTITNNLLDVTRIEAGRLELVLKAKDLRAIVEAVADEFRPQLDVKSQQLTLRAKPGLPRALCDEARAMQVVGNLLSNASKYTPQTGLITITVGPAPEEGFLEVSVADNGVGIAVEDQARLFSRFFRTEGALLSGTSGAGLGLYITRSLVELHGGRIWLESEPGQGSTFHVTFPIADDSAPAGGDR